MQITARAMACFIFFLGECEQGVDGVSYCPVCLSARYRMALVRAETNMQNPIPTPPRRKPQTNPLPAAYLTIASVSVYSMPLTSSGEMAAKMMPSTDPSPPATALPISIAAKYLTIDCICCSFLPAQRVYGPPGNVVFNTPNRV